MVHGAAHYVPPERQKEGCCSLSSLVFSWSKCGSAPFLSEQGGMKWVRRKEGEYYSYYSFKKGFLVTSGLSSLFLPFFQYIWTMGVYGVRMQYYVARYGGKKVKMYAFVFLGLDKSVKKGDMRWIPMVNMPWNREAKARAGLILLSEWSSQFHQGIPDTFPSFIQFEKDGIILFWNLVPSHSFKTPMAKRKNDPLLPSFYTVIPFLLCLTSGLYLKII